MYVRSQKYEYFGHWLSDLSTLEVKNFDTHLVFICKIFGFGFFILLFQISTIIIHEQFVAMLLRHLRFVNRPPSLQTEPSLLASLSVVSRGSVGSSSSWRFIQSATVRKLGLNLFRISTFDSCNKERLTMQRRTLCSNS